MQVVAVILVGAILGLLFLVYGAATSAGASTDYDAAVTYWTNRYIIPKRRAQAMAQVESNWNPRAQGLAGEIGLYQIKPVFLDTVNTVYGTTYTAGNLYTPEVNIEVAMRGLAWLRGQTGSLDAATQAFHLGLDGYQDPSKLDDAEAYLESVRNAEGNY